MSAAYSVNKEDVRQAAMLMSRSVKRNAARDRYAAAMYFNQRGMLSDKTLEVYRTCAVIDGEDPRRTLKKLGLLTEVEAIERTLATSSGEHTPRRTLPSKDDETQ